MTAFHSDNYPLYDHDLGQKPSEVAFTRLFFERPSYFGTPHNVLTRITEVLPALVDAFQSHQTLAHGPLEAELKAIVAEVRLPFIFTLLPPLVAFFLVRPFQPPEAKATYRRFLKVWREVTAYWEEQALIQVEVPYGHLHSFLGESFPEETRPLEVGEFYCLQDEDFFLHALQVDKPYSTLVFPHRLAFRYQQHAALIQLLTLTDCHDLVEELLEEEPFHVEGYMQQPAVLTKLKAQLNEHLPSSALALLVWGGGTDSVVSEGGFQLPTRYLNALGLDPSEGPLLSEEFSRLLNHPRLSFWLAESVKDLDAKDLWGEDHLKAFVHYASVFLESSHQRMRLAVWEYTFERRVGKGLGLSHWMARLDAPFLHLLPALSESRPHWHEHRHKGFWKESALIDYLRFMSIWLNEMPNQMVHFDWLERSYRLIQDQLSYQEHLWLDLYSIPLADLDTVDVPLERELPRHQMHQPSLALTISSQLRYPLQAYDQDGVRHYITTAKALKAHPEWLKALPKGKGQLSPMIAALKAMDGLGALLAYARKHQEAYSLGNPLDMVPGLVSEVSETLQVSREAASLYLMMLVHPSPDQCHLSAVFGWGSRPYHEACAELVHAGVLLAEREGFGVPDYHFPHAPTEGLKALTHWKQKLYRKAKYDPPLILEPYPILFQRAWERLQKGDGLK